MDGRWTVFISAVICRVVSVSGNNIPVFIPDTYPAYRQFNESSGTAAGVALFMFTARDPEGVTPQFSYTFDPSNATSILEITESSATAGERTATVMLKAGKEFDHESQSVYKIYADAYDGVAYAGDVLLTMEILDVGEAPTLSPARTVQNFTITESSSGTMIGNPDFTIVDGDAFETHTWIITGGTGASYININPTNGTINLKNDYDLEAGALTEVYVDVEIVDKYSLTASVTYSVFVTDLNDNSPVFDQTSYSFMVNQTLTTGSVLVTFNATDSDVSSPNNVVTYSLDPAYQIADYFEINGSNLVLAYNIDMIYGTGPYVFYVIATDGGSPSYSATATLTISTPAATTTEGTTTNVPPAGYDFSGSSSNVALMIAACLVAACLLGYVLVLCWRWHTFGECLPAKCPSAQECNRCCECCHNKNEKERIGSSEFGQAVVIPPSKKGMEAMSSKKSSKGSLPSRY